MLVPLGIIIVLWELTCGGILIAGKTSFCILAKDVMVGVIADGADPGTTVLTGYHLVDVPRLPTGGAIVNNIISSSTGRSSEGHEDGDDGLKHVDDLEHF